MATPIERDELRVKLADGTIDSSTCRRRDGTSASTFPARCAPRPTTSTGYSAHSGPSSTRRSLCVLLNAACTGSAYVAAQLEGHGYRNARRYIGSKQDWADASLAVETS